MLELGRFYNKNILVSCPKGFYRRGNIEIFCKRYGIDFFENLEDLTNALKNQFKTI
jgi:nickel-dependent lactate racemase